MNVFDWPQMVKVKQSPPLYVVHPLRFMDGDEEKKIK
jgi:hypothetical protein